MVACLSAQEILLVEQTKHTITYTHCQESHLENTLEYNYITTEKYMELFHKKYQKILP